MILRDKAPNPTRSTWWGKTLGRPENGLHDMRSFPSPSYMIMGVFLKRGLNNCFWPYKSNLTSQFRLFQARCLQTHGHVIKLGAPQHPAGRGSCMSSGRQPKRGTQGQQKVEGNRVDPFLLVLSAVLCVSFFSLLMKFPPMHWWPAQASMLVFCCNLSVGQGLC